MLSLPRAFFNPPEESAVEDLYRRMPRQVRIGCYTFQIEISERFDADAAGQWGHTNFVGNRIRLSPDMSRERLANTFIHECLHAMHHVYGLLGGEHSEEEYTTLDANALCAFYRDNPEAFAWWQEALGEVQ